MRGIATGIAIAAVFLLLFSLIAGCAQSSSKEGIEEKEGLPKNAAQESGPAKPLPQPSMNITEKINTSAADNKTAYEKNQSTIAKLIADGTYSGEETYAYHSGTETVKISITVKDDTIQSASVQAAPNAHPVSAKIIKKFNEALPDLVVGKKINEISIPKNVAGSSLTTAAFKAYLEKVAAKQ